MLQSAWICVHNYFITYVCFISMLLLLILHNYAICIYVKFEFRFLHNDYRKTTYGDNSVASSQLNLISSVG